MTDELVSFTMLVVSDVSAERDLLRRAALNSSFHVEVTEIEKCVDDQPIRALFLRESVDFIFLDSRMPKAGRQAVINAAADAKDNPLVVLVGPADIKTREVITDGLDFDGLTGINGISIDLSDNADAGFWSAGSRYWVIVGPVTVNRFGKPATCRPR